MNRARTLAATAVIAAFSAWPVASFAQSSSGAEPSSGTLGSQSTGGSTTGSGTTGTSPSDSVRSTTGNQGSAGSTSSRTGTTGSSYDGTMGQGTTSSMSDADWERGRASAYSLLPMTSYGYVGLNLGRANWGDSCDGFSGIYNCDDSAFAGKFYTGGLISRMVGLEIGYVNFGRPDTQFGSWKAHGVNASIVANLPIDPVNIFARFGTTYGWTNTPAGAGTRSGDDDGFGISYGAGIGYDVTPQIQVTAEWDRTRFNFVNEDQDLDMYSLGVRYRF